MVNNNNTIRRCIKCWRDTHKIGKWGAVFLLEGYRRVLVFDNGNFETRLLLLSYPSTVKKVAKAMFKPAFAETPRVLNWYSLTDKGIELLLELHTLLLDVASCTAIKSLLQESVENSYENLLGGSA